jgi:hypothetical protein
MWRIAPDPDPDLRLGPGVGLCYFRPQLVHLELPSVGFT